MTSRNKWFARNVDMVTMSKNASMWWLWQMVLHVLSLPCPCDTLVLSSLFSHCPCLWYVDLPYLQSFVFIRKIEVCRHEFDSIVYTQVHDQTNKFDSRFLRWNNIARMNSSFRDFNGQQCSDWVKTCFSTSEVNWISI